MMLVTIGIWVAGKRPLITGWQPGDQGLLVLRLLPLRERQYIALPQMLCVSQA